MLSFKEYLTEVFDKPYPFIHKKKITYDSGVQDHQYEVHTDDKKKFMVHINHDPKTGKSNVGFQDQEGRLTTTGDMGHRSGRIIASVASAVKHHLKNTPTAKSVTFEGATKIDSYGNEEETGRNRLYQRISSRMGGTTTKLFGWTNHEIPADRIRAA